MVQKVAILCKNESDHFLLRFDVNLSNQTNSQFDKKWLTFILDQADWLPIEPLLIILNSGIRKFGICGLYKKFWQMGTR